MSEEEKKGRSRKQPKEEPQETSLGKEILSWLQIIVAAVVIAFVLNNFVIANSRIPTGSMENTIMVPQPCDRFQVVLYKGWSGKRGYCDFPLSG